jgi:hypothetical protein
VRLNGRGAERLKELHLAQADVLGVSEADEMIEANLLGRDFAEADDRGLVVVITALCLVEGDLLADGTPPGLAGPDGEMGLADTALRVPGVVVVPQADGAELLRLLEREFEPTIGLAFGMEPHVVRIGAVLLEVIAIRVAQTAPDAQRRCGSG